MSTTGTPGAPDDEIRIFVSYAREDRKWLDPNYSYSLIPFLVESLRRHRVLFWFDKELKPGDEFSRLIQTEIDQSQIALLIVSQSFLNSEFIENREMPRIAERARVGKMIVVPVLVEPCDWSEYPFLADRQMVPSSPLIDYADNDAKWAKVRFQILDGLKAQLKRIREAPQTHASSAAPQEATEQEAVAQAVLRAEKEPDAVTALPASAPVDIPKPANAPKLETAAPPSEPTRAVSETHTISTAGREKARNPRIRVLAILGGAALAWGVSFFLFLTSPQANWLVAVMGGAPLVVVFVSLQVFKPFPRNWAPAVVGLAAVVWIYLVFFTALSQSGLPIFTGQVPMVVLVGLMVLKPLPRNWTPVVVGGVVVWASLGIFSLLRGGFALVSFGAVPLAAALTCLLVLKPANAPALDFAAPPLVPTGTVAKSYAAGREKARNPFKRVIAFAAGAILVIAVVLLAIYMSHGKPWTARTSGTSAYLESIFGASDGKHLWAVGVNGTILESDDGGATWAARSSGTTNILTSIVGASDGQHLWAVGEKGTILESVDGGASWTAHESPTTGDLQFVFRTSDGKRVWAVGWKGAILESEDGGANWLLHYSRTVVYFNSAFGTSDDDRFWAVGDGGAIVELDEQGEGWTVRNSGTPYRLRSIFGIWDGSRLWAVGENGTIVESDDAGATWKVGNSGTKNDLYSIFGTGDGKQLWIVGDKGTILESLDGGVSWKARNSGTSEILQSVTGTSDGHHLWAVGANGTILELDR